jgi:hypothetical protein
MEHDTSAHHHNVYKACVTLDLCCPPTALVLTGASVMYAPPMRPRKVDDHALKLRLS